MELKKETYDLLIEEGMSKDIKEYEAAFEWIKSIGKSIRIEFDNRIEKWCTYTIKNNIHVIDKKFNKENYISMRSEYPFANQKNISDSQEDTLISAVDSFATSMKNFIIIN